MNPDRTSESLCFMSQAGNGVNLRVQRLPDASALLALLNEDRQLCESMHLRENEIVILKQSLRRFISMRGKEIGSESALIAILPSSTIGLEWLLDYEGNGSFRFFGSSKQGVYPPVWLDFKDAKKLLLYLTLIVPPLPSTAPFFGLDG